MYHFEYIIINYRNSMIDDSQFIYFFTFCFDDFLDGFLLPLFSFSVAMGDLVGSTNEGALGESNFWLFATDVASASENFLVVARARFLESVTIFAAEFLSSLIISLLPMEPAPTVLFDFMLIFYVDDRPPVLLPCPPDLNLVSFLLYSRLVPITSLWISC